MYASEIPAQLRDFAAETVQAAAQLIRQRRGELIEVNTKSSNVDPVTEVDTAAEEFIAQRIREARPQDGILGEEGADKASESGVRWIVDPIDGTVNFLYGIPEYAVSIGAAIDGELVAGAVINVARDRLYMAALGHGAEVRQGNDAHALRCRTNPDPATCLVATGFSYLASRRVQQAQLLVELLPQVRDIRRMGAAALDLCRVAEGSVDIYYEHGINPWDFAAGAVIAREAGAEVSHPGFDSRAADGDLVWAASAAASSRWQEVMTGVDLLTPLRS